MPRRNRGEIIQELQARNIAFDGGSSDGDLLKILKASEKQDTQVNAPGSTVDEDEGKPVVQPLETVPENVPVSRGEQCWNCKNADRRTKNRLDENGVCGVCGFNKGELYNGNIEADKAAQRIEAARAAEQ